MRMGGIVNHSMPSGDIFKKPNAGVWRFTISVKSFGTLNLKSGFYTANIG